jgi:hypothetical protein
MLNGRPIEPGTDFVKAGYGIHSTVYSMYAEFDELLRAGRNRYESDATSYFNYPLPDQIVYDFDDGTTARNSLGDLGFGADEVISAPGDSGAPSFGSDGSILAITSWALGGHSYTLDEDETTNGTPGEVAVDLVLSNYLGWIRAAVSAFGNGQIRANIPMTAQQSVPEPMVARAVMAGLFLMGCKHFRRRRSAAAGRN